MKKLVLAALFSSLSAFADDGGIAIVNVAGVVPADAGSSKVEVYGGDVKALYDVLPETAVPGSFAKSIALASRAYAVSIYCIRDYERPTTHQQANDYMCGFEMTDRRSSHIDDPEYNGFPAEASKFSAFSHAAGNNLQVDGINPDADQGKLFAFYGNQAAYLAANLPGRLSFTSAHYRVNLQCQRDYIRPTTGEHRSDWMCTASLDRR